MFHRVEPDKSAIAPLMRILSDTFDKSKNERKISLYFRFHHAESFSLRIQKKENLVAWSATKTLPNVKEPYYYLRHVSGNGVKDFNISLTFEGNERREFQSTTTYFTLSDFLNEVAKAMPDYTQHVGMVAILSNWRM
jgi:hypothetical protein